MRMEYAGGSITQEELIKFLFLSGRMQDILPEIIKHREIMKAAAEFGLAVSDEKLQEFCDNFRRHRGLHSRQATLDFLSRQGLTEDDFEGYCEALALLPALKDKIAGKEAVEKFFVENRSAFDRARISIIKVAKESLANEILMQVNEDGEDFHKLAGKYSMDETRYGGGYLGLVERGTFPPEISAKLFSAAAGDTLGPFSSEGVHLLIHVEEILKADLSDGVRESARNIIFNDWLAGTLRRGIIITT